MGSRPRKPGTRRARPEPGRAAPSLLLPEGPDGLDNVRLTHGDRVLYPAQGITKRELAQYMHAVASWMLPHVAGRPLTLVRCPEGTARPCIFMKHSGVWAPRALRRISLREKLKVGTYLVAEDEAGLLGLAQMGVVEIHTWNSTADHVEQPDRVVFDLDPDEGLPWSRVIEAALLIRSRLDALGMECFVKTSGGKGLHVVMPLQPELGWDECLTFSRVVAHQIARAQPSRYTAELSRARRKGRILIDYLRNNRGSTSVAAFSPRARSGAPVSMPISWDELISGAEPPRFELRDVVERLRRLRRDPWHRYWTLRQDLRRAIGI